MAAKSGTPLDGFYPLARADFRRSLSALNEGARAFPVRRHPEWGIRPRFCRGER